MRSALGLATKLTANVTMPTPTRGQIQTSKGAYKNNNNKKNWALRQSHYYHHQKTAPTLLLSISIRFPDTYTNGIKTQTGRVCKRYSGSI